MKTLYFSGTGNCLYAAKKIGGELISIPRAMKEGTYVFKDDVIGIVFPVYWLSVPALIREFLSQTSFECDYLFGIVTYGDNNFGVLHDLNILPTANGKKFDYMNAVKMTENYLPMYEMAAEIEKAKGYDTENCLNRICEDIRNKKHAIPQIDWFSKTLTKVWGKKHCRSLGPGEAARMTVNEECIACGQCTRICPMENISLQDGKVTFGTRCSDCLGCIQNCPKNAIHIEGEKSTLRYRNPDITVRELE